MNSKLVKDCNLEKRQCVKRKDKRYPQAVSFSLSNFLSASKANYLLQKIAKRLCRFFLLLNQCLHADRSSRIVLGGKMEQPFHCWDNKKRRMLLLINANWYQAESKAFSPSYIAQDSIHHKSFIHSMVIWLMSLQCPPQILRLLCLREEHLVFIISHNEWNCTKHPWHTAVGDFGWAWSWQVVRRLKKTLSQWWNLNRVERSAFHYSFLPSKRHKCPTPDFVRWLKMQANVQRGLIISLTVAMDSSPEMFPFLTVLC